MLLLQTSREGASADRAGRAFLPPARVPPLVTCDRPVNFLPTASLHPLRTVASINDAGAKPPGELFHSAVPAGGVPYDPLQVQIIEAMPDKQRRDVQRQAISSPFGWCELDAENGSCLIFRAHPQACAPTEQARVAVEHTQLKVASRIFAAPAYEDVEQIVRAGRIGFQIVEPQISGSIW